MGYEEQNAVHNWHTFYAIVFIVFTLITMIFISALGFLVYWYRQLALLRFRGPLTIVLWCFCANTWCFSRILYGTILIGTHTGIVFDNIIC